MSAARFTTISAAIGVIVSGLFVAAYRVPATAVLMDSIPSHVRLDTVMLVLAPPSAVMIADFENDSVELALVCILGTGLLYGLLGWLLWLGLHRSKFILLAPAVLVAGIWTLVLR